MASIGFYIAVIVSGLIGGTMLIALGYLLFSFLRGLMIKKKIPQDKSPDDPKHWRTSKKKNLADPGNKEITEKEVEEIEREQYNKFREFEKLRRAAESKGTASDTERRTDIPERTENIRERSDIQAFSNIIKSEVNRKDGQSGPDNKKRIKLHRLDD